MEKEPQRFKILYVGNNQPVIQRFRDCGCFDVTCLENPLASTYWLTDNHFKLFDLDNDTRFDIQYEEKTPIYIYIFLKSKEVLVPPKPKELDMATVIACFRATLGT